MEKEGADIIDVGAMSSAPYLKTEISETEEAQRLSRAVRSIKKAVRLPISIDTYRFRPAVEGLEAGASILNDITGLSASKDVAALAKEFRGLILMAHPRAAGGILNNPLSDTLRLLKKSLVTARRAGVRLDRIVLDPGIGFFRTTRLPWWKWDLKILKDLQKLTALGRPLLVGVSRKSFIGRLMGGVPADQRLSGSLAAAAVAVYNGASLIRTHDVRQTCDAMQIVKTIREFK
jgi:dihydropteroate synthase